MSELSVTEQQGFCPFHGGACQQVQCWMWSGGADGVCVLAKAAAALPEIEKRMYDIRSDLRDGLTDIRTELECR